MENKYENLIKKYQHLFTNGNLEPVTMFGIECADGWYFLISELLNHIDQYFHHKYKGVPEGFQITQIKEKFGDLRIYADGADNAVWELIRFTENLSHKTCEYCGSNQNILKSSGWIVTACKQCTEKNDFLKTKQWKLVA